MDIKNIALNDICFGVLESYSYPSIAIASAIAKNLQSEPGTTEGKKML